jgi:protein-S-isoprenylcysteine O-methyltransferase Ste14
MTTYVLAAGLLSAVPLLLFLCATLVERRVGIWPTPGRGTWQSIVFWVLFRTANVATLGLAMAGDAGLLSLPWFVRAVGLAVFAACGGLYLYALLALGRSNTYCERDGLVTRGLYRWTRNPQYATVIPAYAGLAVAADSGGVFLLASLLIGVYVMMAHAEEPWLSLHYGEAYRRYARAVPRFFGARRVCLLWRLARLGSGRTRVGVYSWRVPERVLPATIWKRH